MQGLETFVLRYLEQAGGVWDEVEPQVYDLLLPDVLERELGGRVTFDPEALQDHPAAQLLAFGNPALDFVFEQAQANSRVAKVYLGGLNLAPHNLAGLVQRGLQLPAGQTVSVLSQRPLHYMSALWWFQATFTSDEKVQETYAIGTDLHYGRITRHLEEFMREGSLSVTEDPQIAYPDTPALPLTQGYALAREEATRAITVAAHERLNELQRLLLRETERIAHYFDDSRTELDERAARAKTPEDGQRFAAQRTALDREQAAQTGELRRKMALSVSVRLIALMQVCQPKVRMVARLSADKRPSAELVLTYDPAQKKLDAVPCPTCQRPTLSLALNAAGKINCPECAMRLTGRR